MSQITPIRGFTNTPTTKALCTSSVVSALVLSVLLSKQYVNLTVDPFIVKYAQYWRVATFQLAVVNESDLLLTVVLWFHFKTLERLFGPRKYFSLVSVLALYNAVATFLVLSLGQLATVYIAAFSKALFLRQPMELVYYDTIFNSVVPGPLGILASLYICHGTYIPVQYRFNILLSKPVEPELEELDSHRLESSAQLVAKSPKALTLTNHFQVHLFFTILMLNHGFRSIIPCLVGIFVGKLYTQDLLAGSRSWVLPSLVFHLFVAPSKLRGHTFRILSRRWRGYSSVPSQDVEPSPPLMEESNSHLEEEDPEVAVDDIRQQAEQPLVRSTSPVRPLGRQFLNTFRA